MPLYTPEQSIPQVDVLLVLGMNVDTDGPSGATRSNALQAAGLLERGAVGHDGVVLASGRWSDPDARFPVTEAEAMQGIITDHAERMRGFGRVILPESGVEVDPTAHTTFANVGNLYERYLADGQRESVGVVSYPGHAERAAVLLRALWGPEGQIILFHNDDVKYAPSAQAENVKTALTRLSLRAAGVASGNRAAFDQAERIYGRVVGLPKELVRRSPFGSKRYGAAHKSAVQA